MRISKETIFSWMGIVDTLIGQLFYKSSTPEGQDLLTCYMEKFKDTDTQNFLEWFQKMVLCLDEKDDAAADLKEQIFGLIEILIDNFIQQLSPQDKKVLSPQDKKVLSQYITRTMMPTNIIQSFQENKTDYSATGLVMFVLFILLI
jgi:hypothetical protein